MIYRLAILIVWIPAAVVGIKAASIDERADRARKEVLELERGLDSAILKGDVGFFEQVLAEDFTHTSQSGVTRDRKQWLANHKPGESPYKALNTQDLVARNYGDVVLVTGRIRPTGRTSSGQEIQGEYRFLRVWVNGDSGWKAVAFQSTRIADPEE